MLLIVPGITFASSMVISFMYHVVLWSSGEHLCNNRDSCSLFPILLLFMSYCYMPFHPQTLLQFSFISSDSVLYCQISKSFSMLMLPQFCIIIIIFHQDMHIFPLQYPLHENIKLEIDMDQHCSCRKFATYFPLVLLLFSAQTPVICVLTILFSFRIHSPLFIN